MKSDTQELPAERCVLKNHGFPSVPLKVNEGKVLTVVCVNELNSSSEYLEVSESLVGVLEEVLSEDFIILLEDFNTNMDHHGENWRGLIGRNRMLGLNLSDAL